MHLLLVILTFFSISKPKDPDHPVIQKSGKAIQSFVPVGWEIIDSVYGDLNGDGLKDAAIVIQSLDSTLDTTIANDDTSYGPLRILVLLTKSGDGSYRCAAQANHVVIGPSEPSVCIDDPFWSPDDHPLSIRRGVLQLHMEQRCGSSYWKRTYRFRYQNSNWYLIGALSSNGFQGSPDLEEYDVNLLTHRMREGFASMDHPNDKFKTLKFRNIPLPILENFEAFGLNIFGDEGI